MKKNILYIVVVGILCMIMTGCKKKTYTVTYEQNNGNAPIVETVNQDECAPQVLEPEKRGHTFSGWYLNDQAYDFNLPVTEDINLVAKWEVNKQNVYFITNTDLGTVNRQVDYGSAIAPLEENLELSGYTFVEWQLNGVAYDFNQKIEEDIYLTAIWEKTKYTVTFDTDGGSFVEPQLVTNGSILESVTTVKENYTFLGWYLNDEKFDFSTPIAKNIELVAKWEKHLEVTIHFNNGDKDHIIYVPKNKTISSCGGFPTTTYDGYRFVNYYYDESLTVVANEYVRVSENLDIYYKWDKIYYITYELLGGTCENLVTEYTATMIEKNAKVLNVPNKENYYFRGWYESADYSGNSYYKIEQGEKRDITLYAKWVDATLENAYISFLGDSISTYKDQIPSSKWLYFYPCNGVNLKDTWWKITQETLGCKMGVNNSASGSCVMKAYNASTMPSAELTSRLILSKRYDQIPPDIMVVFIGMNDSLARVDTSYGAKPEDFEAAYRRMLDNIYSLYPKVDLFLCTLSYECNYESGTKAEYLEEHLANSAKLNEVIRKLAAEYDIPVIDFTTAYNSKDYLVDTVHPNALGMQALANKAVETIQSYYKNK